jgi:glycosyltransferase involved in cell wall biosynthesis
MKVSIVIPAYNAEGTVGLAVSAALAQGCPDCEVVVADDGSTDGTAYAIRRYPIKYVRQDNKGPAAARNLGWRASSGEVVIFTDSDCVPQPGWTRALVTGFRDDRVGAVTGSYGIANPDDVLPRLIHEEIKDRHFKYGDTVKFFGSYNVAIRRSVLEETGGFDEGYRRASGEDNDLSYRIIKAGYKIAFSPDALVSHYHTTGLAKYLKEQYTHGYWRMKLYKAHPDMAGGDDYTRIKDVVEPPLALINLCFILFLTLMPQAFALTALMLFVMQVPAAARIAIRRKAASYLLLAPVTFLRGYARGLGMFLGLIRFHFLGGRP